MAEQTKKITPSFFINTLLNGMAAGIVVALIANAVLGQIFKALAPYGSVFGMLYQSVADVQYLVSAVIGFIVGIQLGFVPIKASMMRALSHRGRCGMLTALSSLPGSAI